MKSRFPTPFASLSTTTPHCASCPLEAHVCVHSTVLDLVDRGFTVHLVGDAVLSRTKANWRNALDLARDVGAIVTNAETVIFQLLGASTHPRPCLRIGNQYRNLSAMCCRVHPSIVRSVVKGTVLAFLVCPAFATPVRAEMRGLFEFTLGGIVFPLAVGAPGLILAIARASDVSRGNTPSPEARTNTYVFGGLNLFVGTLDLLMVGGEKQDYWGALSLMSVVHTLIASADFGLTGWGNENPQGPIPGRSLGWLLAPVGALGLVTALGNGIQVATNVGLSRGRQMLGYGVGGAQLVLGAVATTLGAFDTSDRLGPLVGAGIGHILVGAANLAWAIAGKRGSIIRRPWFSLRPAPLVDSRGRLSFGVGLTVSRF